MTETDSNTETDTEDADGQWLVYLYNPDDLSQWTTLGLVDDRDEWVEWWRPIMLGEVDLPARYDGWWISDRPVSQGLPSLEDGDE